MLLTGQLLGCGELRDCGDDPRSWLVGGAQVVDGGDGARRSLVGSAEVVDGRHAATLASRAVLARHVRGECLGGQLGRHRLRGSYPRLLLLPFPISSSFQPFSNLPTNLLQLFQIGHLTK